MNEKTVSRSDGVASLAVREAGHPEPNALTKYPSCCRWDNRVMRDGVASCTQRHRYRCSTGGSENLIEGNESSERNGTSNVFDA